MSSSDSEVEDVASRNAATHGKRKRKQPDLSEFLQTNDEKRSKFHESEEDESMGEGEEGTEDEPQALSATYVQDLTEKIKSFPNVQVCKDLMLAFNTVVEQLSGEESVKLLSSDLLNDIIRLCLVELVPALNTVLKVPDVGKEGKLYDVGKSKAWKKLATSVKRYLAGIVKILSSMTEPSTLTLVLKHVVHLAHYYIKSPKLSRLLLKKMIVLWSSKEEGVRVRSLVVIYRMCKVLDKDFLHYVSKHMYFAYVSNTKFTSVLSWPIINFMKQSLVEVYLLDTVNAYESCFVYIRQLSIHLRNAVTMKKKEAFKIVYNWQYIHSIMLWAKLLGVNHQDESLKTLVYPLVQTVTGAIHLIPAPKYFPLRFHLVRTLMKLSEDTKLFIPVLPIILQVLTLVDFNKKLGFSKKPIDFTCCLKLSKSQLQESGFTDAVIDQVCDLLLEYFKANSHNIAFPELALPSILQLKSFIKKCKVSKYCQLVKQVVDKVSENSSFIMEKRKSVNCKITDNEKILQWERNILAQGTPLIRYLKGKVTSIGAQEEAMPVE